MLLKTLSMIVALGIVLALCATADAGWRTHVTPVYVAAPGPVVYYGYWPGRPVYRTYRPVVVAEPVVAVEPVVVPAPVVYGAPVVYPGPVVVRSRAFYPGRPIRNTIRAVLP